METLLSTKRVAKNTLVLYGRLLITMIITLYTSRVLLNALGVEDFGIYNVVAGFVVLFNFLQSAFQMSTTRFIGVSVTSDNPNVDVSKTYCTSYALHLALVVVIAVGLETIGLWYMLNYMNIPAGRENASLIVYHLAVINACITTLRVPDNAIIVAYEKMNFYAFIGVADAVLKLGIAFLIQVSSSDKLITYSVLMVVLSACISVAYFVYSHKSLQVSLSFFRPDMRLAKNMFSMIGWNSVGGVANLGYQQGINLVLNFFFGVTLNAAMGIANQVKGAVYSFVQSIRTAADPQIIKSYAVDQFDFSRKLVSRITRLSHYLLLFLTVPIIMNVDYILTMWLKTPPDYASTFVTLMLLYCILDGLMGPLWVVNQATGDVRKYQLIRGVFYISNIPLAIIVMKLGFPPEWVIIIGIVITLILFIIQIPMCTKPINMKISDYYKTILLPIVVVSVSSFFFSYLVSYFFSQSLIRLILCFLVNTSILAIVIMFFGITKEEKQIVVQYGQRYFEKIRNRV